MIIVTKRINHDTLHSTPYTPFYSLYTLHPLSSEAGRQALAEGDALYTAGLVGPYMVDNG